MTDMWIALNFVWQVVMILGSLAALALLWAVPGTFLRWQPKLLLTSCALVGAFELFIVGWR